MLKSVSHAVSTREPYITPRSTGPSGDIGRGLKRHVIHVMFIISYISSMTLITHIFYENFDFCLILKIFSIFKFYENFDFFFENL